MADGFQWNRPQVAFTHDLIMAAVSFPLSLYLRIGDLSGTLEQINLWLATALFTATAAAMLLSSRLYRGIWRYASLDDLLAITKAVTLTVLVFLPILFLITRLEGFPRSLPVINWLVLLILLGGPRFAYRLAKDRRLNTILERSEHRRVPVLLIGAGDEADLFIREQKRDRGSPYQVVGAIDEKGSRVGREIHGVRVLGTLDDIETVVTERCRIRPERAILTKDQLDGALVSTALEKTDALGLTLARLPKLSELKGGVGDSMSIRPIAVEDILGRPQSALDRGAMRTMVEGRRVLVTGAGGSIGSELVRQICLLHPAELTLLDNSEHQLYLIDREVEENWPELTRRTILGDVRDRRRVGDVVGRVRPDLVFHAAALKHVPMVELNPMEGVLTNAVGTRVVADACRAAGVETMVLISTDKAVNPTNVMGATKRLAESYCQAADVVERETGRTRFVVVRFGNVLGSTGSVVPLFQRQLEAGGPLTVTHPDVTRYFMTVREAVELVLQASALGSTDEEARGRVFVLDMGQPVKILTLAEQMIRLAGLEPYKDIDIEITGLRPGEKLHEELLHDDEHAMSSRLHGLMLATPRAAALETLALKLDELERAARARQREETLALIRTLIPEYTPDIDKPAAASG